MEISAEFIYKSEKKELIEQMKEKTLKEIKKYDERRKKKEWKIVSKKREIKIKNIFIFFSSNLACFKWNFPLIITAVSN